MKVHDISPPVHPGIAVFPGDTEYRREVSMHVDQGEHLTLSAVTSTLHLGAHADAPVHFARGGRAIDAQPLEPYLGPCQVIDVRGRGGPRIAPEDLDTPIEAPRVLLRTDSFPDPDTWRDGFRALAPELVDFLADAGCVLVGIDTPSVDVSDSKDLPTHARLHARDVANLEGLWLADVPAGSYTLVALPLRLRDADASPVRAVLLPDGWPAA
jgi:arylformamidase